MLHHINFHCYGTEVYLLVDTRSEVTCISEGAYESLQCKGFFLCFTDSIPISSPAEGKIQCSYYHNNVLRFPYRDFVENRPDLGIVLDGGPWSYVRIENAIFLLSPLLRKWNDSKLKKEIFNISI